MEINDVLARMRALESVAKGQTATEAVNATKETGFGQVLKQAIDQVNDNQAVATKLSADYAAGVEKIDLPEVMVAMQESSVGFEAVKQVRNRVLSAYQEIMNMPV